MIRIIALLYYITSMFLPTLYICILGILGFFSMEKSYMLTLSTSLDPLLSILWMLSFSIKVDVIHVTVVYMLYHNFYL